MSLLSAGDLVAEYIQLDDFVDAESKKFKKHLEKHNKRMEEIRNLLLQLCNDQKTNSLNTNAGTAYISTILTPKIVDREAYLDFVFDEGTYDEYGNEMLQLSAPQKDKLREYIENHANKPPPGVEVSYFNRLNIRRS